MAGVHIIPVRQKSEMKQFIGLPWNIYEGDDNWVPPLKFAVKKLLNPKKHPYWKFSERELFLAKRGDEIIGRIAAIVDGNYNEYSKEKMGIWGFFECRRDPEAFMALFSAAENWVRKKGMDFLRGPLNPSPNYEIGLLIQGFESPPSIMMPYNPPYYAELISLCGFRKEKDLFSFLFKKGDPLPDWAMPLADRISKKNEIYIRKANRKELGPDLRLMNKVYVECWGHNWGFVPMSNEELEASAKEMEFILDPDLAFFLYHGDEAVGVFLALPNINPFLKRLNGKLGPTALIKKFRYWSEVDGIRILLFGVKEKYRQMGVPLVVLKQLYSVFENSAQYKYIEAGWTLEDNQAINGFFQEGGMKPYKKYRIFRKDLH
ncbi:acyl-CoA N-acyltransferase [Thermodesulfobacteriota bacterium]